MLLQKNIAQWMFIACLALSASGFAAAQTSEKQATKHAPHTPYFEGQAPSGFLHYEGDMEDTLANPLDSTNEELDEEAEELEDLEKR